MAAAEKPGDSWLDQQRVREERMRYEVLYAIYHATDRLPCIQIDTSRFLAGLGVWREELERVLRYLGESGFLTRDDQALGGTLEKGVVVCITQKGIDYLQQNARRRKTIRDQTLPHGK